MKGKPKTSHPGVVQKIIKPLSPQEPERVQIAVEDAEDLYKEIRIDNTLEDAEGKEVKLKEGAHVEVTVEAEVSATVPKNK